jgi:hypothetical protein
MGAGHMEMDLDDFILTLIRDPGFSEKVNDIAVECGNSLYQPILDRYISGGDVPFSAAKKVWRDTTQPGCSEMGFYEQFFPLVRAINQKLPLGKRLRVLACDPPINWSQVKTRQDLSRFAHRDASIASVIEREVLAKHRRALMLFGEFQLFHGDSRDAVTTYEKTYPNTTFVIDYPGYSDLKLPAWPVRAHVRKMGFRNMTVF